MGEVIEVGVIRLMASASMSADFLPKKVILNRPLLVSGEEILRNGEDCFLIEEVEFLLSSSIVLFFISGDFSSSFSQFSDAPWLSNTTEFLSLGKGRD